MRFTFLQTTQQPVIKERWAFAERDQQLIHKVAWLFRDSLRQTEQQIDNKLIGRGEQQKWLPVLRDAHGNIVHRATPILLKPTVANEPQGVQIVVQWVLPHPTGRKAVLPPQVHLERKPMAGLLQEAAQQQHHQRSVHNQHADALRNKDRSGDETSRERTQRPH